MAARHKMGSAVFEKAGGVAPTIGVLGTVVSLVHVLSNLSAPETLGPSISAAFIATLYGVGSANVVYMPVCYSLQMLSQKEVDERTLVLEGILAIQAGDNPRMVQQKLLSYLAPAEREAVESDDAKPVLKAVDDTAQAA
jgi:chemotaxis protein MotA